MGQYIRRQISAYLGRPPRLLVFGIEDGTHAVVGTRFDPAAVAAKGNQLLPLWLSQHLQPNIGYEIHPFEYHGERVVMFQIHPAYDRPVKFDGTAYIRDGTSKTELSKYPEKERQIWNRRMDWSAQVCERATLDDLDPAAIAKARAEYKTKFPAKTADVDGWDDDRFPQQNQVDLPGRGHSCRLAAAGARGVQHPAGSRRGADELDPQERPQRGTGLRAF